MLVNFLTFSHPPLSLQCKTATENGSILLTCLFMIVAVLLVETIGLTSQQTALFERHRFISQTPR